VAKLGESQSAQGELAQVSGSKKVPISGWAFIPWRCA